MLHFIVTVSAAFTAFFTVKTKALTPSAATSAAILILGSGMIGGWFGLAFLLTAYYAIAFIDRLFHRKTASVFSDINQKTGARDAIQVTANGLPALLSVILFGLTGKIAFLIGFAAALTEAFADSIASDVGVLSKRDPISICRFKRIPRGVSGGVSLLGTTVSLLSSFAFGAFYYVWYSDIKGGLVICAAAFCGCILDSILGDLLQVKFLCPRCGRLTEKAQHCGQATAYSSGLPGLNNCAVNFISNLFAAVSAILLMMW